MYNYVIVKQEGSSVRKRVYIIIVDNGSESRVAEIHLLNKSNQDVYIKKNIANLFDSGTTIQRQKYFAAVQRSLDELINSAIMAIYSVFISSENPTVEDVFVAAESVLGGTPKERELRKLIKMLSTASNSEIKKFIALTTIISLSKSGRG
jgi:hypothetical protein